jgi:hypothetical protein
VRPDRFEAAAYDHGFRKAETVKAFGDLDEALIYAAGRGAVENGRTTVHSRAVSDVRGLVRDTETDVLHAPDDEHKEACIILGDRAA